MLGRLTRRIGAWSVFSLCVEQTLLGQPPTPEQLKEEALLFTPPGFERVGEAKWDGDPAWSSGGRTAQLEIVVRDAVTSRPTPCRVNVVGADGNFYQPALNALSPFALTGRWPTPGQWGNRIGKAPYRYVGRFFYMIGETTLRVPAGAVRVEVWKGFEYRPAVVQVDAVAGGRTRVDVNLARSVPMAASGYYAGDPHVHIPRDSDSDDQIFLDLIEAEDVRFGVALARNDPDGAYTGFMDRMVYPQRSLGRNSIRTRGDYHILSGQEYRSSTYGHLNLYLLDELMYPGASLDSKNWPVLGEVGRETKARGGFVVPAHGGYAKEVYVDAAVGAIHAIELLQFGVYRGVGLEGWYDMLNAGYRMPVASGTDYPPCRMLADGRTYVYHASAPTMPEWIAGMAAGKSFLTTGPLLLLEVDGERPGAQIRKRGSGAQKVTARVRVRSEVTPVTNVDLIVNGRVVERRVMPREEGQGKWLELVHTIDLPESAWIAARAYSTSPGGQPDAEAHTNPIYVYLNDRAPFKKAAVDAWIARIDGQIATQSKRIFPESTKVLSYFQQARDVLLKIREQNGLAPNADPAALAAELNVIAPGMRNLAIDGSITDPTDAEMKAFLKPAPPKSPTEALQAFETVGGFRMELVAAEPLVRSPVAAAFDEDGKLFVAEMSDYPYNPGSPVIVSWQRPLLPGEQPIGSIRLLRDTDGDGVFDKSTVFADKVLWATGIAPWKGGIYVSAGPDIWYFKDTDGDDRADIRQKIFSGFGLADQQSIVNSLILGLDHKIYGATGANGGEIRPGNDPTAAPISLKGRDFRFAPDSFRLELQTGTKQFGMSFDDWGNRFLCNQSGPCFHVVLPLHYLERNPHFTPPATLFTATPPPTPLFRISQMERWRHIRSSRRFAGRERPADIFPLYATGLGSQRADSQRAASLAGVSHHVVDATAGITIYRGGAYPKEYYGNMFVGDSVANLVHRRVLVPHGATFRAERVDVNTEFVRSSDLWFRPVNFVNAPDGTLYCLDMGREHSETENIPPDVEKHLDLASGLNRGRIYRIAPADFRSPPPPRLSRATAAELVGELESPHGWWRDTAHRLIFERQDKSAVPALERMVTQSGSPQARVHALWSLQGLGGLNDRAIVAGLSDSHAGVRENAVRLAEARLVDSSAIRDKIVSLVSDPEPRMRLQVAFTLGESRQWNQPALLARMARENLTDSWIQSAIISSAAECGGELFAAMAVAPGVLSESKAVEFLRQLAVVIGFQNRAADVTRALNTMVSIQNPVTALPLLGALGEGLKRAGTTLAQADGSGMTKTLLQQAATITMDAAQSEAVRRSAIEVLALVSYTEAGPTLLSLLAPKQSPALQVAAIGGLEKFPEPQLGPALLERYRDLAPIARTRAIDVLLERPDRIGVLLDAIQNNTVARTELSAKQVAALRQHGDERIRDRTTQVLGAVNPAARQDILRTYLPALALAGVAERGKAIFESRCSLCHRRAGVGFEFGPDLSSLHAGGREKLLSSILDPNREVAPQYFVHSIDTKNGESTGGILKNETATAVTLLQVGGVERTIARANIARMKTERQSLMPEGLETGLTTQDMADLIEFLFGP